MIDPTIFRQYDIRGIVGQELTTESLEELAKGFASFFFANKMNTILVGYDNRHSSKPFRDILVSSLVSKDFNIIDLGCVTTPMFYFASRTGHIPAGIMITASHNPANYNGFKILLGESTIYGDDIQRILRYIQEKEYLFTENKNKGEVAQKDILEEYHVYLLDHIKLGPRKLKIALDCGNGTASITSQKILESFGVDVVPIYCDSNPDFPNHFPDPVKLENCRDLAKAVRDNHCDAGIGLDGDGDRIGLLDENGSPIWGDIILVLFAREILKNFPGEKVLVEVKCSQLLVDEVTRLGGKPEIYKTGHSLIKARMKEIGAILAGEMSGHMFLKDEYFGFDDATYAGLRILRILSNSYQSLSEMLSDLPTVYSTPEIRAHVTEKEKFLIVEKAKQYLSKEFQINDIDGVRAIINNGWGLIRASNTGPEIIIRAEATTAENLAFIKKKLETALQPIQIPWE